MKSEPQLNSERVYNKKIFNNLKLSQFRIIKNILECWFDDRKTVKIMKNRVGIIKDGSILTEDNLTNFESRLSLCSLPEEFRKDGLKIIFSGEIKEIYPNERWAATPFKITDFEVVE